MKNKAKTIAYRDRKDAYITVARLDSPYGPESEPVISIGCTLKGKVEDPSWKVHIPLYMIPKMINILNESFADLDEKKERTCF